MDKIINIPFLMEPQVIEIAFGLDQSWRWWERGMSLTIGCPYIFSWPRKQMRAVVGQVVILSWMLTNEAQLGGNWRVTLPWCGTMGTEQGPRASALTNWTRSAFFAGTWEGGLNDFSTHVSRLQVQCSFYYIV